MSAHNGDDAVETPSKVMANGNGLNVHSPSTDADHDQWVTLNKGTRTVQLNVPSKRVHTEIEMVPAWAQLMFQGGTMKLSVRGCGANQATLKEIEEWKPH
jgi:hypothetical protein